MHNNLAKNFRWLFAIAALSFMPALFFYYVGEEAIHPIIAMEMHQHGEWIRQPLYGQEVQHIPLYNWLILFPSNFFGWQNMLVVARSIAISSTILSAFVLAWFARRVFRDNGFAIFTAVAYLTLADVSIYRGWLAYVDPLYALLVFSSIATLVVGTLERHRGWLLLAALAISLAFMSRALTAYVFYGASVFVLLWNKDWRKFLLSPPSLLIQAAALMFPLALFALIGHPEISARMLHEITGKLSPLGWLPYLEQATLFPLETMLRLSPLVPLAIYLGLRKRVHQAEDFPAAYRAVALIALLNLLPYWFSPQSSMRYILPLCPLFALVAARIIWRSGDAALALARNWVIGMLVLKFILVLVVFPYYQEHYRGKNYADAAADIDALTKGYPLYVTDVSSSGLNVAAYVDQRRHPAMALQWPPDQWNSGYVISRTPEAAMGKIYKKYQLAGDEVYLLCRGTACENSLPAK